MSREINRKLDLIIRVLTLLAKEEFEMAKSVEDLAADVEANTSVTASIQFLISGLVAQVAALKSTQTDPATAAKIDELAQKLEANNAALTSAISANTSAALATPTAPTVPTA